MPDPQQFEAYAGKWIALLGRTNNVIAADSDLASLPALVEERGINFCDVEVMRIEADDEDLIRHSADYSVE